MKKTGLLKDCVKNSANIGTKTSKKMHSNAHSRAAAAVEYIGCVLKLSKNKFACYVEEHVGRVPSLNMTANAVTIVSTRKKAWRAAMAMALLHEKNSTSTPRQSR